MKSKNVLWLSVLAIAGMFAGCSKNPISNLTAEESRIYITNHDSTKDFKNFHTFSISDSVAVLNNGEASKQLNATDQAFIDAVSKEMQNAGYALVGKTSSPDVAINLTRIYNTSTGIISYDNYYDYYGSYWDPYNYGYGGYGYYSPYSYASYSVREGALSVDMLDLKDAPTTNKIEVIWTGLIRGAGIFDAGTAASQVNALFVQSPYLKSN